MTNTPRALLSVLCSLKPTTSVFVLSIVEVGIAVMKRSIDGYNARTTTSAFFTLHTLLRVIISLVSCHLGCYVQFQHPRPAQRANNLVNSIRRFFHLLSSSPRPSSGRGDAINTSHTYITSMYYSCRANTIIPKISSMQGPGIGGGNNLENDMSYNRTYSAWRRLDLLAIQRS